MKSLIGRMGRALLKRRLPAWTEATRSLADRLRQKIAGLPPLPLGDESPAGAEWLDYRRQLRRLAMEDDPRRFLEWRPVRDSMFVGDSSYIPIELAALRRSAKWRDRWSRAVREDAAGMPQRSRWRFSSSGNIIHHAYSLHQFEEATGRSIDSFDQILEFGGGYGSLCRIAHRLGFRGEYLIVDFPEFCALQQYFLDSVALERPGFNPRVKYVTDLAQLPSVSVSKNALFIALWSLSETPLAVRRQALETLDQASNALVAYQQQFGEVDNCKFFGEWVARRPSLNWTSVVPAQWPESRYLFGSTP
jgi:hypothetical protein